MNLDRALIRSKQFVNILWSIFFLVLLIYIAYFAYRRKNKKKNLIKANKKYKKSSKSSKKNDEETSMMMYPSYSLDSSIPHFKSDDHNMTDYEDTNNVYTYQDLLKIIQDEDDDTFFTKYVQAVKEGLKYKQKRYSDLLKIKALDAAENDDKTTIIKPNSNSTIDVCAIIEEILDLITSQLKTLSVKKMRANFKRMVWHKEKGLETLIEREEVKDFIASQIFSYNKHQKHFFTSHQNGLILGSSGMGKSKIGQCLAHALSLCGIMVKDEHVCVSADRIKSPYVDDTGRVCRDFFEKHLERAILLEEIYSITPPKNMFGDENRSHGSQAIDVIVDLTEVYKGLCRIYGIGYADKTIEQFIKPNEGMERRFPRVIHLKNLSDKGLAKVLIRFLTVNSDLHLSDVEANAVYGMILKAKDIDPDIFDKEAGSMENLATDIGDAIFETKDGEWIEDNSTNNIKMLLRGFNKHIKKKTGKILVQ